MNITINPFDSASIKAALDQVKKYKQTIENGSEKLLDELATRAQDSAQKNFDNAVYAGESGGTAVSIDVSGKKERKVIAQGDKVLFMEFGTGVVHNSGHPEAGSLGMIRGEYGRGLGKNPNGWTYIGTPGSHAPADTYTITDAVSRKGEPLVRTKGNDANRCMYNAKKEIEQDFSDIAKECFK
jgi:DNA-binding protein YbaB